MSLMLMSLGIMKTHAQVGIPSNNPNKNSVLDLNKTDGTSEKGLLLPKVALSSTSDPSPLSAHTAGMYVYNTALAGTTGTAVSPGEYYNDGKKWIRVATSSWSTTGNAGTNSTNNFVGTNDAAEFAIKTDNTERLRINTDGNILVGNSSLPTGADSNTKLIIDNGTQAGGLQIVDGTQGDGKILTSDGNGLAYWAAPFSLNPKKLPTTNISRFLLPYTTTTNSTTYYNTGTYFTIPPGGRWLVNITMLLDRTGAGGPTAANEVWEVYTTLRTNTTSPITSSSPASSLILSDNKLILTTFPSSSMYCILRGSVVLDTTILSVDTTFYLFACNYNAYNPTTGSGIYIGSPAGASESIITYKKLDTPSYSN